MAYYVTKYALTTGIQKISDEEVKSCRDDTLVFKLIDGRFDQYMHGEGKEWHKSEMAAVERAESMRKMKIESLKKSIAKIEKIKFQVQA